jgi:hypothetical protein
MALSLTLAVISKARIPELLTTIKALIAEVYGLRCLDDTKPMAANKPQTSTTTAANHIITSTRHVNVPVKV